MRERVDSSVWSDHHFDESFCLRLLGRVVRYELNDPLTFGDDSSVSCSMSGDDFASGVGIASDDSYASGSDACSLYNVRSTICRKNRQYCDRGSERLNCSDDETEIILDG